MEREGIRSNVEKSRPRSSQNKKKRPRKVVSFLAGDACRYEVVRKCARDKQKWKLVPQSMRQNANVIWVDTSNINDYFRGIKPWQTINHFPGMTNIARKSRLAENLEVMRQQFPKDFSFCPKTYVLPQEAQILRKDHFNRSNGKSRHYFIIKPSSGCQGRGIYLACSWDAIDTSMNCVAQKYIRRPLLIDKKKFDLRLYVLVTSCKPLRMYLFREGLVRLCTEDFVAPNAENTKDICMHLTNYSINKYSEKFESSDNHTDEGIGSTGSKRSLSWFMSWLKAQRGEESVDNMWAKIGQISVKTVISILPALVREYNATFGVRNKSDLRGNTDDETVEKYTSLLGKDIPMNRDSNEIMCSSKAYTNNNLPSRSTFDEKCYDGSCSSSIDENDFIIDYDDCKQQSLETCAINSEDKTTSVQVEQDSRCFQILGFDILIDENLKPHLIEVNHLPSFGTDHDIDKKVKGRLIEQVMSIIKSKADDKEFYEEMKKKESDRRLFRKRLLLPENKDQYSLKNNNDNSMSLSTKHFEETSSRVWTGALCRKSNDNEKSIKQIKHEIGKIYRIYAPHKIKKLAKLFLKYRGSERWLLAEVKDKYVIQSDTESHDKRKTDTFQVCYSATESEHLASRSVENEYLNIIEDNDGCEAVSSNENGDKTSTSTDSNREDDCDSITEEETSLLVDFDRVYPPVREYTKEKSSRGPKYKAMEEYIFKQDSRQQMRLICPLRQARKVDPSQFTTSDDISKEASEKDAALYKVWSSECWSDHSSVTKKRGSRESEIAVAPIPNTKQLEVADRLSRGIPANKTKPKAELSDAIYPSCYIDPSWQLSCRIFPIKHKTDDNTNEKQKGANAPLGALHKKGIQVEAIKPVNFDFGQNKVNMTCSHTSKSFDVVGSMLKKGRSK